MKLKKSSIYFSLFYFICIFLVYIKTLAPGIIPEDSGELAVAGFSIGIAHPPGYPLYVLLLKLFLFIPFDSIIFRANLFSALCSATATVSFFHLIYYIKKDRIIAVLLSCIFAFSRSLWSQSIIAEVYTLNILILILFIYFTLRALNSDKNISVLAFLSGLLIVSHYSNILIIISAIIALLIKYKKHLFKLKYFIWGFFPLTLFFVLIIRSQVNPLIDWGNPENSRSFFIHILRLSFGSMISKSPRTIFLFVKQFKMFIQVYILQFGVILSLILFIYFIQGMINLIKYKISKIICKETKVFIISAVLLLSIGIILILNYRVDEEMFYINHLFFIPFILVFILIIIFKKFNKLDISVLGLLVLLLFIKNFAYNNRSNEDYTLTYNRDILKNLNYNSILFTAKDFSTFPLLYYNKVETLRPDVKIYDWFGNVFEDIFQREDFHLIPEFKRDSFREQITDRIRVGSDNEVYYSFQRATLKEVKSLGLVYTYNKLHDDFNFNYLDFSHVSTNDLSYLNYFTRNMISVYYFHLGFYYKQQGDTKRSEDYFKYSNKFGGSEAKQYINLAVNAMKIKDFFSAIEYLKKAINDDESIDKAYFYLGNIYFQQERYFDAERMYLLTIQKNRLNGLAYNNLGNLYLKTGNRIKAKNIFQSGLITGYGKLFYNLGSILIKDGQIKEAKDIFLKGIEITPDFLPNYLQISVIFSKLNDWDNARIYLEKAYKLDANNKNILLNLGLVYIKQGNKISAEKMLLEGRSKFPNAKEFNYYLDALNKM